MLQARDGKVGKKGSRVRGFGAHHVGNAQTRRLTVGRWRGDSGRGIGPNFECRNVPKSFVRARSLEWITVHSLGCCKNFRWAVILFRRI